MSEEPGCIEAEIRAFITNLESQHAYSSNTLLAYQSDLQDFTGFLQQGLNHPPTLEDIDNRKVSAYLEAASHQGLRPSTILRRRASLRRFQKYLRNTGLLDVEVIKKGENISLILPLALQSYDYLSEEEIEALWQSFEKSRRPLARRDQAILEVLLETGLSVSTLIRLNLPDLDLRARKLHIRTAAKEDHWLPLGKAVEPLARYLQEGRPELHPPFDEPALFISQTGARMSRQSVWQMMQHWGNVANMRVTLSPRLFRHTAALRLAKSGRPLSEIQVLLGHGNRLSTQALLSRLQKAIKEK